MLNQADITTTIKSIPWFLELNPASIQRLASVSDVRLYENGEVIFSEGEQHPFLYIVLEGKVLLESLIPGRGLLPIFTAEVAGCDRLVKYDAGCPAENQHRPRTGVNNLIGF